MRQSSIVISIQTDLDKEDALMQIVIDFLTAQKAEGNIKKAGIDTQEIEVPVHLDI